MVRGYKDNLERLVDGKDSTGKQSFNTVFGDKIVVQRHADIEEQFHYNINTKTLTTTTANSGAVSVENDMLKLSSSTNTAGSAKLTSKNVIRYRPGYEGYAIFTALWENEGVATSVQHIGPTGDNDGFYIGYTNTDFVVGRRLGGTDTEVTEANFNGDDISGLDKTKLNIFRITWGWLGTATISFQWKDGAEWRTIHNMVLENKLTRPHVNNPMLPIQAEVTKTAGATDIIMRSGSWDGGMMGEDDGAEDRYFTATVSNTNVSAETVLLNLENQTNFQSQTNRVEVEGVRISIATEGTKTGKVKIYRNLAIGGSPSWSNVDATNSVIRKDTAGTVTPSDANLEFEYNLSKAGQITDRLDDIDILLHPTDTLTITGQSAANMDFDVTIRWKEHF